MLMLLFHAGKDLYAIESSRVVEVIPRVPLRPIHRVPEYVAGLFNYRGTIVPVIDLCHLIRNSPSRFCLSTRIIMVSSPLNHSPLQYLGLIAEKVTETLYQEEAQFANSNIRVKAAPYIGGIIMDKKRIIQHIHLDLLFSNAQNNYLLVEGEIDSNEPDSN